MNIPPAPVSRRIVVSTILSVLHIMGRSTVNDLFPISARNTDKIIVESDPNVEVGRSFKNPRLQACCQINSLSFSSFSISLMILRISARAVFAVFFPSYLTRAFHC